MMPTIVLLHLLCLVSILKVSVYARSGDPGSTIPCFTDEVLKEDLKANPELQTGLDAVEGHWKHNPMYGGKDGPNAHENRRRLQASLPDPLEIPINVHILKHSTTPFIGYEQIISQIRVLNDDFNKRNSDAGAILNFDNIAANFKMTFVLNKIIRKSTSVSVFSPNEHPMKYDSQGGSNSINPQRNLNMWVSSLCCGLLGFATFPGEFSVNPNRDGVVLSSGAFGSRLDDYTGTWSFSGDKYDEGRTCTHEVGHWVNLRHIWGDGDCNADDFVADTHTDDGPNFGCPQGDVRSCGSVDIFTNFMDYTDDNCMNMFTVGQLDRADDIFLPGGARESFAEYDSQKTEMTFVNMIYFVVNNVECMMNDKKIPTDINYGSGGVSIHLCVSYSRNPFVDVIEDITMVENNCPVDYEKIDTNLNYGNNGTPLYACYKKVSQTNPLSRNTIIDLSVYSFNSPQTNAVTTDKFKMVLTNLNQNSGSSSYIYIGYKDKKYSASCQMEAYASNDFFNYRSDLTYNNKPVYATASESRYLSYYGYGYGWMISPSFPPISLFANDNDAACADNMNLCRTNFHCIWSITAYASDGDYTYNGNVYNNKPVYENNAATRFIVYYGYGYGWLIAPSFPPVSLFAYFNTEYFEECPWFSSGVGPASAHVVEGIVDGEESNSQSNPASPHAIPIKIGDVNNNNKPETMPIMNNGNNEGQGVKQSNSNGNSFTFTDVTIMGTIIMLLFIGNFITMIYIYCWKNKSSATKNHVYDVADDQELDVEKVL